MTNDTWIKRYADLLGCEATPAAVYTAVQHAMCDLGRARARSIVRALDDVAVSKSRVHVADCPSCDETFTLTASPRGTTLAHCRCGQLLRIVYSNGTVDVQSISAATLDKVVELLKRKQADG